MKNSQKVFVIPLVVAIVAILAIGGGVYIYNNKKVETPVTPPIGGIVIEQPVKDQEVQLPITVKGYINGNGWQAFEGQAGTVQVVDANNKAVSNATPLKATDDWMQTVVHFEATVGDREMMSHLTTSTGFLVFKSEDAKDDSILNEFRLPIKFANNQTSNWKTYTNAQYNFSVQYPPGTNIDDRSKGTRKVSFHPTLTKGVFSVDVVQPSANCIDTASGVDVKRKIINGIDFIIYNIDRESSSVPPYASARLYCAIHNEIEYKIISSLSYTNTPLDVDKDVVLNQILSTFKFTK